MGVEYSGQLKLCTTKPGNHVDASCILTGFEIEYTRLIKKKKQNRND